MKVAIYARVSTDKQSSEMQTADLKDFAKRMGWETASYTEEESTRKRRPELERLLADAAARKFDVVLVWKLDRFGRSVQELAANIQALDRSGIRFIAHTQGIDTDQRNPGSRLLLNILASVAEFERDLIRERVVAGVQLHKRLFKDGRIGKDRHTRSGKDMPAGGQCRVFDRQRARDLFEKGNGIRAIARELGVGVGTIHRLVHAEPPAPPTPPPTPARVQKGRKKGVPRTV